jgi:replicative DNA helicase
MSNPEVPSEFLPAPPAPHAPRLFRPAQLLEAWAADAEAAHQARRTGTPRGPATGIKTLDSVLGGALAAGLHVLHGGHGAGKTALALQMAATCGFPALYLSAETHILELFRRIVARVTGTFLGRLRSGELAPYESLALARQAAEAVPLLAFADATESFATVAWLRDAALATRGQAAHVLVVIDSAHEWAESAGGELAEYDRLNAALAGLRTLAGQLNAPVLALAERNRASIAAGGLSAAAGTRRFEYAAATVLDLNAADEGGRSDPHERIVTLRVAKNRYGAAGREIRLRFHGALQRFTEEA